MSITTEQAADRLLTVREVAKQLRVDDTTVRRWIKGGALRAVTLPHIGRRKAYRVHKRTIDKMLGGAASYGVNTTKK